MRNAFAEEITRLGRADPRVVLLSGDIGNRLFDGFKDACPDRFYNCGIAEAGMVGLAAGLALAGFRPVCYTIAPFLTYRCLEQIRIDLCYHHLPVVLVGTGGGLAYAALGATHQSCEELGMLRLLPGLNVLAAADAAEVQACLRATLRAPGPSYLRIGKKGEPRIHAAVPAYRLGDPLVLREGREVCFLSSGTLLPVALAAADALAARGHSAGVISLPSLKPLDPDLLGRLFAASAIVATVEEHSRLGGLGGAVAEWLADQPNPPPARLLRFGTADEYPHRSAGTAEARAYFDLTPATLASTVAAALAPRPC